MSVSWAPVGTAPNAPGFLPLGNISGLDVVVDDLIPDGSGLVTTSWDGHATFVINSGGMAALARWIEREELLAEARLIAREVVRRWAREAGY